MITVDKLPERMSAHIRMDLCDTPGLAPFCWTWTAGGHSEGYGWVYFSKGNRGLTHRYAYTLLVGEIPAGLEIDHLCRHRRCCNPAHLEPVTGKVNQERGIRRQATHCQRGHEFSGHNLIIKKSNGCRECRACKYESMCRSVARRRAKGLPNGHRLHGTITGYQAYACRCDECRAAGAAAWQRNPYSATRRRPRRQAVAA